jgi:uncharacterized protein (DUF2267 family)
MGVFNKTLAKTHIWLNDLMEKTESDDEQKAYRSLRAVLHALRDALSTDEVAQFGAQLPMLLRGSFYEGWDPATGRKRYHKLDEFLVRIRDELTDGDDSDVVDLAYAVFGVVCRHVSGGEIRDILRTLPPDLRALWPETGALSLEERAGEGSLL